MLNGVHSATTFEQKSVERKKIKLEVTIGYSAGSISRIFYRFARTENKKRK